MRAQLAGRAGARELFLDLLRCEEDARACLEVALRGRVTAEYACARECLWMNVSGPPRVLPFEYGSGMCMMLRRTRAGLLGSATGNV